MTQINVLTVATRNGYWAPGARKLPRISAASGNLRAPDALKRIGLSDSIRSDTDLCATYQVHNGAPLEADEAERYSEYASSSASGSLYEHYRSRLGKPTISLTQIKKQGRDFLHKEPLKVVSGES